MAIHMYLKLDKIVGDSKQKEFEGQIEVLSWTWGLTQSGSAHHGSGTGTAGVTVGDVSIVKYVDRSTPTLMKYCCAGTFFDEAKLSVLKAGDAGQKTGLTYLALTMKKGLVSSVNSGGVGPHERLIETISLNFKEFTVAYTPQEGGSKGGDVLAGWDIVANKPV
jgi:type VI secretion system secreted protein Hcp